MKVLSNVVFFPCKDIQKTVEFYRDTVGIGIWKDMGDAVLLDSGYGYLGFVYYGPDRPMTTGTCISFNMEDNAAVDAKFAELLEKGVVLKKDRPVLQTKFPVYSFFVEDPNGYTVEFQKIGE